MKITKGCYIRRTNFLPIGKKIGIEVQSVRKAKHSREEIDGPMFFINGKKAILLNKTVIISKEEAEELNKLYEECTISENEKPGVNSSCTREDNGQPKQKFPSPQSILPVLFRYRQLNPEGNFEAYKCATCGFYHLGKTMITVQC